jgi:hypothetical protein
LTQGENDVKHHLFSKQYPPATDFVTANCIPSCVLDTSQFDKPACFLRCLSSANARARPIASCRKPSLVKVMVGGQRLNNAKLLHHGKIAAVAQTPFFILVLHNAF